MKRAEVWLESTHTLASRGRGRTGVGHYTEEVIANLLAVDPRRTYSIVGNVFAGAKPVLPKLRSRNAQFRLCRFVPGKLWNQLFKRHLMPPLNWLIPGRPALVVFFNFVRYPVSRGVKTITTIHDLAYLTFPESVEDRNRAYLTKFVPRAIKRSTHLIAISEATKRDLMETYGVAAERIGIVNPGVDLDHFRPTSLTPETRARLKLPERYFLFVSTLEPRKNVLGLIQAYRALPDKLKRDYALVLTGPMGWNAKEIEAALETGDPVGTIMKTSYVLHDDMPALFSGATAYVLPSLYEGFSMTPVEAMACGTPVITSNNSALPEVVGDAGILIDATDTAALTQAMARLVADETLRQDFIAKGLKRARKFTWERSGQQLKTVIDQVLGQP